MLQDNFIQKKDLIQFLLWLGLLLGISVLIVSLLATIVPFSEQAALTVLPFKEIVFLWQQEFIVDYLSQEYDNCPAQYSFLVNAKWPGSSPGCVCWVINSTHRLSFLENGVCSNQLKFIHNCSTVGATKPENLIFWNKKNLCIRRADYSPYSLTGQCFICGQFCLKSQQQCPVATYLNQHYVYAQLYLNSSYKLLKKTNFQYLNRTPDLTLSVSLKEFLSWDFLLQNQLSELVELNKRQRVDLRLFKFPRWKPNCQQIQNLSIRSFSQILNKQQKFKFLISLLAQLSILVSYLLFLKFERQDLLFGCILSLVVLWPYQQLDLKLSTLRKALDSQCSQEAVFRKLLQLYNEEKIFLRYSLLLSLSACMLSTLIILLKSFVPMNTASLQQTGHFETQEQFVNQKKSLTDYQHTL